MRSNPHKTLYRRLLDVTTRVEQALVSDEGPGDLELFAAEHGKALACLKQIGLSRDPELLDLVRETNDRVCGVIEELKRLQAETRRQMAAVADRKRLTHAYERQKI